MFCVECGTEAGDALTQDGLCHVCFLEKNRFTRLPPHVDLEVCVHCQSRRRGEHWFPPGSEDAAIASVVADTVEESLEVDPRGGGLTLETAVVPEDDRNYVVTVDASGLAESVPFTERSETRARLKNATCARCSRIMGGYYEGVVQVRAEKRDLSTGELRHVRELASRVIDRIVASGDSLAFVLKDEVIHGGLDITVGTISAGRAIARAIGHEYGSRVHEHPKIAGRQDGEDMWRVTFGLRLPEYTIGDVLVLKGTPYLVTAVNPKHVSLRDTNTGQGRKEEHADAKKGVVLRRDEARDAVVVTADADELQLLDPWSFATVTVTRPSDLTDVGEVVPVLRWEGEVIPLPPT